jgi:hypothetical protein
MIAAWFQDRALAFDTETTAPDPAEALLVSANFPTATSAGTSRRRRCIAR